jgi:hypothetical protein
MEPRITQRIRESLPALLIFALLFLFSFSVAFGQEEHRVIIKGHITIPRGSTEAPYACLTSSDGEEMEVAIRRNGGFWVNAPEADRYTITFSQNGSYTKQVVVDAHNAGRTVKQRKERTIEFDVVLRTDDSQRRQRDDGAVGSIAFHPSNGRMKVAHHYQMMQAEQPDTLIAGGAAEGQ